MTTSFDPCAACRFSFENVACLLSQEESGFCCKKMEQAKPEETPEVPINFEAVETD